MIQSAVLKLTFAYLAIVMALSISFSITLYRISDSELSHGLRKPGQPVFRETSMYDFDMFRETRINEGRQNLKSNLVLLNLITFGAGLAASYLLARKTLEPIEEAMKSQMQFTADASHELRTPLTAMQTEIEVALRDKNLSKTEARELLESNLEEVEKLRRLSDGLLQLAQQRNKTLYEGSVAVAGIVHDAKSHVLKQAGKKKITIAEDIAQNLKARGDQVSLAEVVAILLDNAIKYSDNGTLINVTARQAGAMIEIRVSDQGVGIEPIDLPNIFNRFYRADASRTKKDVGGYGLGLSIAKKIIDLHGGQISVESSSKKGSTFLVKVHKA